VTMDGKLVERFSTAEEAVAAVDYEVSALGRAAEASALDGAAWRSAPAPEALVAGLPAGRTGRRSATMGEAVRLKAFGEVVTRARGALT